MDREGDKKTERKGRDSQTCVVSDVEKLSVVLSEGSAAEVFLSYQSITLIAI